MKTITDHHDGFGLNDLVGVVATDEDADGVPHRIEFIREADPTTKEKDPTLIGHTVGFLQFQKGPRNVEGSTPGLLTDAVLVALIEIHKGFQAGPFSSREGAIMLTHLETALLWSQKRAKDRSKRGVLGYNKP